MDWPITTRIAPSCRARRDLSSGIKVSKPEVVRFRTFVHGPLDMLLECPSTAVVRNKYFSSTTLKELFSNVDARCILDFTKESGFYHAI